MTFASPTLQLTRAQLLDILAHCYDCLPDEGCGMLGGPVDPATGEPTGVVEQVYPCVNADASARTYTVDPRDLFRSMRDAEGRGGGIVGVFHSHTHTAPYPSETDVRQAPDPNWIYVLASLRPGWDPSVRAYRIVDGVIAEVAVEVTDPADPADRAAGGAPSAPERSR